MGIGENIGERVGQNTGMSGTPTVDSGGFVGTGTMSTVSGTFAEGDTLTFAGTGFGTHAGIIVWDNFNSGSVDTVITNRTPVISTFGDWTQQGGYTDSRIKIDDTHSRNSTNNAMVDWTLTSNGICAFGFAGYTGFNEIYMSYYRYMTGSYDRFATPNPDNHKQFYIFGDSTQGAQSGMPQAMALISAGDTRWGIYNNSGNPDYNIANTEGYVYLNTDNEWQRWEHHFVGESDSTATYPNADGIVKEWINGNQYMDIDYYKFGITESSGWKWEDVRLGHMAQGMTDDAQAWFDEVYFALTPKRIEISQYNTYIESSEQARSIQPHSSWSNTQIQVTCNQSDLPTSGALYAYQIDDDDTVVGQIQVRA